jgi:hypothetical protein
MEHEFYNKRCKKCGAKHDEAGEEDFDLRFEKCDHPLESVTAFSAIAQRIRRKKNKR